MIEDTNRMFQALCSSLVQSLEGDRTIYPTARRASNLVLNLAEHNGYHADQDAAAKLFVSICDFFEECERKGVA